MTAYSAHIVGHHAKRVVLMNNVMLKKCTQCFGLVFHDWKYCIHCGNDVSLDKACKKAFAFPVLKTQWGDAKLKELYKEEVAFLPTNTTPSTTVSAVASSMANTVASTVANAMASKTASTVANTVASATASAVATTTASTTAITTASKTAITTAGKTVSKTVSTTASKTANTTKTLKGMTNSVSKMLFEGEIVEPIDLSTDEKRELIVDITDRTVKQNGKERVLLQDIHLKLCDGEMCLILGGSGAGKTTFLNAVMGAERANAKVTYGGIDLYKDYDRLKHFIGYVAQMDPLRMDDTVYMTLHSAAQLKLPKQIVEDKEQLNERIKMVLETVSLTEESENLVRKLSGGQKKRLNIAVEYITNPHLFFLDEPDSGLDGSQARILMENLRTIADTGKIVMLISHVPDRVLHLFDKVIVLAKDKRSGVGGLSFFGSVKDALQHYQTETLEGIVAVLDKQSGAA